MILPDKPIRTKEEDLFNRSTPATAIAEVVRSCDVDSESFVVGIEGKWGSGKTSLINLVLENLESENIIKIHFNPWNFSDQNQLITDFFDSIADVLKGHSGAVEKIRNYALKLLKKSSLSFAPEIPYVGLKLNFPIYEGVAETLEKQKKEIGELLKKAGKRIVIIIDDIDRLDAEEVELVFKLVKKSANFENIVFLLAYDRDKVGQMMSKKGIPGEEFLKKLFNSAFLCHESISGTCSECCLEG